MSLVTRYGFEAGPLKNAFVGGAIRYQSGAVVGRAVNRDLIIGNSMTITDAFVGYRLRIAKRMVNLQLNVNNLFEFEKPQTTVTSPTGGIRRFSLVPPRTLRLSARLEF
jgi:outer membrane receptor protein involved in Fe transport